MSLLSSLTADLAMSTMEVIFMERLILILRVKSRSFYSLIKMSSTIWKIEPNLFFIVSFHKNEDHNSVENYVKLTESRILIDIHYSSTQKFTYLKEATVNFKRSIVTFVETMFKWKTVNSNLKSKIVWKCTKIVLNYLIVNSNFILQSVAI